MEIELMKVRKGSGSGGPQSTRAKFLTLCSLETSTAFGTAYQSQTVIMVTPEGLQSS